MQRSVGRRVQRRKPCRHSQQHLFSKASESKRCREVLDAGCPKEKAMQTLSAATKGVFFKSKASESKQEMQRSVGRQEFKGESHADTLSSKKQACRCPPKARQVKARDAEKCWTRETFLREFKICGHNWRTIETFYPGHCRSIFQKRPRFWKILLLRW